MDYLQRMPVGSVQPEIHFQLIPLRLPLAPRVKRVEFHLRPEFSLFERGESRQRLRGIQPEMRANAAAGGYVARIRRKMLPAKFNTALRILLCDAEIYWQRARCKIVETRFCSTRHD